MDAAGARVLAVVTLLAGVFLITFGAIIHDESTRTAGVGMTTAAIAYAFGDRTGAAREAAANDANGGRRASDRRAP